MQYGVAKKQQHNPQQPAGMTLQFVKSCNFGKTGEVKEIAHYIAVHLLQHGIAVVPVDLMSSYAPAASAGALSTKGLVTAICPTFNRRKYLPTSIALFLAQTYTNSELLIVDDSTESVEDIVPKHPRIRYVRLAQSNDKALLNWDGRMLIGAKRNVCCEAARGEFIVHWDDDDWQAPGRIADQVENLVKFNKQVLTYCNILYWNDEGKFACRCFPRKEMRALHGATFCYRKAWWQEHPFKVAGGGEDTAFGTYANSCGQLLITDAHKFIVVRAHGSEDLDKNARGNTCRTAEHMGTPAIPKVKSDDVPHEFFAPLLEKSPVVNTRVDAVIGVIKNYDWLKIRAYAVSLNRSGFKGVKLMFVENITAEARSGLIEKGFTLVDFTTPPDFREEENRDYLTFGRYRFKPVLDYLQNVAPFRYIVWCDVRDLVFQSDPSAWLERNMTSQIVAAGEGWLVKDDGYNDGWTKKVSPADYSWLREQEICCSGTFAGKADAMLGIFSRIYAMVLASRNAGPNNADQAMFNYVIRTSPYKEITRVPLMSDGFCATWFPAKSNDAKLIANYGKPTFEQDGVVYTPETHVPFCMVHQFDRDHAWRAILDQKYQ